MKKKSLIIGFGRRAQNIILPALNLNDHDIYIYSKTISRIEEYKTNFKFEILQNLSDEKISFVDNIFISTKKESYEDLINNILNIKKTKNIKLFVDTSLSYYFYKINHFKNNFQDFIISEDEIFDPINLIIKNIIRDNKNLKLFKINLNYYGYIYHSISQIMHILKFEGDGIMNSKIKYAFFLNFRKLKYFLKINETKIYLKNKRDWNNSNSNIELFFKQPNDYNKIKKYNFNYNFLEGLFNGFEVNNNKFDNNEIRKLSEKFRKFCYDFKYNPDRPNQIKILSFYLMCKFYEENTLKNNIDDYIKCEYFASLLTNLRILINLNFNNAYKIQKLLYKLKNRI